MNLEEVISRYGLDDVSDELKELIDEGTIPDPDDPAYAFFEYILLQFNEEPRPENKRKEEGYTELGKMELYGVSSLPLVLGLHESLHAVAAYISGAHFYGFADDWWGLYTGISGTPMQVAFTSLFPHLLAIPAFYYAFYKRKFIAVPFLAPTLTEAFPAFLLGKESDFLIAAENLTPSNPILTKYLLLGGWYAMTYLISRAVYRRNLKHEK